MRFVHAVIATDASYTICFLLAVASPAASCSRRKVASVKSTSEVFDFARSPEVALTEATKRSRTILSTTTDGQACSGLGRAAETCRPRRSSPSPTNSSSRWVAAKLVVVGYDNLSNTGIRQLSESDDQFQLSKGHHGDWLTGKWENLLSGV
jgi:hypothetical protein